MKSAASISPPNRHTQREGLGFQHWMDCVLEEKPWRPEAVLRLLAAIFASGLIGSSIFAGLKELAGKTHPDWFKDGEPLSLIITVVTFHLAGFAFIHVFLRHHGFGWPRGFGFNRGLRAAHWALIAGLTVLRCTHYHSWLVPVAWLVRRTPLRFVMGQGSAEEASFGSAWVNRALQVVTDVERTVLARRDLPVGLSILLVARVPGTAT